MKKLLFALMFVLGVSTFSFASSYKLNEVAIDNAIASAEQVNVADFNFNEDLNLNEVANFTLAEEPTKSGFLIRAFFCGQFALHRSYMGTKGLFIKYFCTFGVIACIDFWWVVFKGDEAFNKFKGNDKWVVWND